jgi:cystathionine gamma-synthase
MSDLLKPETLAIHADDAVEAGADVAPPLHLSSTYLAGNEEGLVYARNDMATRRRLETVLGALEGGHAVTYPSGMAAVHAALHHWRPKRVLISGGYYNTHALVERFRADGVEKMPLETDPRAGDLIWLETPKNPTAELADIGAFVKRAHAVGGTLAVDSTFATPVLQQPLALGADVVMHSSTKFLSGHSDVTGGVLAVRDATLAQALRDERTVIGAVPGALEAWLTLRSLRTLTLRVTRQSESAARVAAWLSGKVARVWHPSLPSDPSHALMKAQMRGGGGVLSIDLGDGARAEAFPAKLNLFRDATSLGGVESLIDWRYRYDTTSPPGLLRLSIGLEAPEDLIADLEQAL